MPTSPYTVFIHIVTCLYSRKLYIYVRCISFGICCDVSLYWGDQVIEYKYVVNLHWGFQFERSQRFFFFWNFYLNNADHQLAKCAVIIVVIISVYPCLLRHNNNNQCLKSMEPARQVYISPPPSDVLYLIRKSGGEKASQLHTTKWNRDICWETILYLSICHWRNWKIWIFSCIELTTWTYLKCAKSYLSSLVNVNTFNHWINVIFIFAANLLCAFYAALFR